MSGEGANLCSEQKKRTQLTWENKDLWEVGRGEFVCGDLVLGEGSRVQKAMDLCWGRPAASPVRQTRRRGLAWQLDAP